MSNQPTNELVPPGVISPEPIIAQPVIELTDLQEKYAIEDERFLFKVMYSPSHNVLIDHSEDKVTGEVYKSENIGELNGRVKFSPETIDDYIQQAIGAAFPVIEEPVGFIFSYDDLHARKSMMSEERFVELVNKYPRLNRRVHSVVDTIRLVSKTQVIIDPVTGSRTTTVIMDNTEANWWSSMSTPEYNTSDVMSPDEMVALQAIIQGVVYSDPIERFIWKEIKKRGEVENLAQVMLDDTIR